MDQRLADALLKYKEEMIEIIRESGSFSDLGFFMMEIESSFGLSEANGAEGKSGCDSECVAALDEAWVTLTNLAADQALRLGFDPNTIDRQRIEFDLYDNHFHAAVAGVAAARIHEPAKGLPLLAWAAFNKHSYQGYKDEIAILRMLLSAGYDPNAQDNNGMTALHYMASMQHYPYSHPRAVRLLLEAGADPNIQNERGDSPLCYLAGNLQWTDHLHRSAVLLLNAGANPHLAANDGATPFGLLNENRGEFMRELIIVAIEQAME